MTEWSHCHSERGEMKAVKSMFIGRVPFLWGWFSGETTEPISAEVQLTGNRSLLLEHVAGQPGRPRRCWRDCWSPFGGHCKLSPPLVRVAFITWCLKGLWRAIYSLNIPWPHVLTHKPSLGTLSSWATPCFSRTPDAMVTPWHVLLHSYIKTTLILKKALFWFCHKRLNLKS